MTPEINQMVRTCIEDAKIWLANWPATGEQWCPNVDALADGNIAKMLHEHATNFVNNVDDHFDVWAVWLFARDKLQKWYDTTYYTKGETCRDKTSAEPLQPRRPASG